MRKARRTIDNLDLRLLSILKEDPTQSYAKVKEKLGVSVGTVYLRVARLKELGIIKGAELHLAPEKLGYSLSVLIRMHVPDTNTALKKLEARQEIGTVYILTGEYNLMLHAFLKSVEELNRLTQYLNQTVGADRVEVQIVLDTPLQRGIPLPVVSDGQTAQSSAAKPAPSTPKASSREKKK
ncbi:MAG: Lrp/AsnC family transcriptional regulator [Bacteroidia bacterium]|nr:Lrp/AsnC family transcriptional regulator [Bacteroidia bacterium]MDW8415950.1 Lrp/AsnC family transcriptional regulator [Bacteroidia bacterium]